MPLDASHGPAGRRTFLLGGAATLLASAAAAGPAAAARRPAAPAIVGEARPPLPLVVLDPGHGGRDPGAIGPSGTYEKHVALAAAQELQRQLLSGGSSSAAVRCRVELTRRRDVFIPLQDRVAFAQRRGAALFVSIHADALSDRGVRGASVYTLADTASDPQAAALARQENGADRFGGPLFRDQPPEVARILSSLVLRETRVGSARMLRGLVGALSGDVPMLPNPGRHAAFTVLRAADVPSVLVEMGFMSNPLDESALRRPDHRARVAGALRRAVETWLASGQRQAAATLPDGGQGSPVAA